VLVSTVFAEPQNSFQAVTSHLDPGGDLYLYLNTEQWLSGLSAQINQWRALAMTIPDQSATDQQNITRVFNTLTRIVQNSGIEDVGGFGISSIERQKGLYRTTSMIYHRKGKGSGYLWTVFGKTPHSLDGINLLPASTAVATFSDLDLPMIWSILDKEVGQSGIDGAKEAIQGLPPQFAGITGVELDKALASLSGECGLILSIDDTKRMAPPGAPPSLQIPDIGVMLVLKVKNETIFNAVDAAWRSNPAVIPTDRPGLKMRTMSMPPGPPINLRPSIGQSGEYFFISSSDSLIEEALAVKAGTKPGLKSQDEFRRLAQGVPEQGNGFTFTGQKLAQTINRLVQLNQAAAPGTNAASVQMMMNMFGAGGTFGSYRVSSNTDEGWIYTGNGGQNGANLVLLPLMAIPLITASVAIPSLLRSRQAAQESSAVANLRTISTAEVTYQSMRRTYGDMPALIRAGLLDSRFTSAVSGYTFAVSIALGGNTFRATATPVSPNSGRYGYSVTTDGVIRYSAVPAMAPPGQAGKPLQ
jgi:hypothetical protein